MIKNKKLNFLMLMFLMFNALN